jgi:phosphotriesterase-related protein
MDRRKFLRDSSLVAGSLLLTAADAFSQKENAQFMGVLGPIKEKDLGLTLIHEHVMADFIGAAQTGPHRYKIEEVVARALPFLLDVKKAGCKTFVDCTGAYLGRDAKVLKQCAIESGLNIMAATGNYGALEEKFLPPFVYSESAEQLAARWISEWKNGIDGTGIRPGLIKTSVDNGPLKPIHKKLLTAAAITHLQTGLSISVHTAMERRRWKRSKFFRRPECISAHTVGYMRRMRKTVSYICVPRKPGRGSSSMELIRR